MYARWLGDVSFADSTKLINVFVNIIDAGFERELYFQTTIVYEYFNSYGIFENIPSYMRIPKYILSYLFTVTLPTNPIYEYYNVFSSSNQTLLFGSAHPTIYVDSYANFGYFGVLVGGILIYLTYVFSSYLTNSLSSNYLRVVFFFFIGLYLRGSVYLSLVYLLLFGSLAIIVFIYEKIYISQYRKLRTTR